MEGDHSCHSCRLQGRVVVTRVKDSWPGYDLSETLVAYFAVAAESRCWAQEAGVMQGLHDRNSRRLAGIVGGRGDQRKSVMKVNDLRSLPAQYGAQFFLAIPCP